MSIFTEERSRRVPSSKFNLSHEVKTTTKFGRITPILCMETLPGDRIKINTEQMIKFMPLVAPTMHRMNSFIHYFFVPNRIVWDEFPDFIKPNGVPDSERPIQPHLIFDGFHSSISETMQAQINDALTHESMLPDYLNMNFQHLDSLPIGFKIPFMPIMAYHRIFQEYYQDQNLDNKDWKEAFQDLFANGNAVQTSTLELTQWFEVMAMLQCDVRAYEKDYFTSALPDTQAMGEVTLGAANVDLSNKKFGVHDVRLQGSLVRNASTGYPVSGVIQSIQGGLRAGWTSHEIPDTVQEGTHQHTSLDAATPAYLDVNGATDITFDNGSELEVNPVTINELRRAIRLQEFLEKTLRGGKRYIEQMLSHWGVLSSDARLDRPEFIGGDMNPVIISEQLATSASDLNILGQQSGQANAFGNSRRRKYTCEEHGWFFALWTCLPRTEYYQGMPRQYQRWDRFDYAWPEFAHLGEQEIKNSELFIGDDGANDQPFGYQSRYAEYKYIPSHVSGNFKNSLDYWHMGRKFEYRPSLSKPFVYLDPNGEDMTRIFTVQDASEDYIICDFYHHINVRRKLPRYGTPML